MYVTCFCCSIKLPKAQPNLQLSQATEDWERSQDQGDPHQIGTVLSLFLHIYVLFITTNKSRFL